MSKGTPRVIVRVPDDQRARWRRAATRAQYEDLSGWMREELDRAARRICPHTRTVPHPDTAVTWLVVCDDCGQPFSADKAATITQAQLAESWAKTDEGLQPGQQRADTPSMTGPPPCPHPSDRRRSTGYATICMDCGERVR